MLLYVSRDELSALDKRVLPWRERWRSLSQQLHFVCVYSMMWVKFREHLLLGFLLMMIPKQETDSFTGMLERDVILQFLSGSSSHLLRFRWSPDALEKNEIRLIATEICEAFLKNKEVSSASWLMRISLSAIDSLCLMKSESNWAHIKNKYGDTGQPCLIPQLKRAKMADTISWKWRHRMLKAARGLNKHDGTPDVVPAGGETSGLTRVWCDGAVVNHESTSRSLDYVYVSLWTCVCLYVWVSGERECSKDVANTLAPQTEEDRNETSTKKSNTQCLTE